MAIRETSGYEAAYWAFLIICKEEVEIIAPFRPEKENARKKRS